MTRTPKPHLQTLALMLALVLVASLGLAYAAFSIFHVDGPASARADQVSFRPERVKVAETPKRAGEARRPEGDLQLAPGAAPAPGTHVIRPGESLWSIAQDRLGRGASDAQLVEEVRRIRQANRGALAKDPNLARPGLKLRLP